MKDGNVLCRYQLDMTLWTQQGLRIAQGWIDLESECCNKQLLVSADPAGLRLMSVKPIPGKFRTEDFSSHFLIGGKLINMKSQ